MTEVTIILPKIIKSRKNISNLIILIFPADVHQLLYFFNISSSYAYEILYLRHSSRFSLLSENRLSFPKNLQIRL